MTRPKDTMGRRGARLVAGTAAVAALVAGCGAEVPQPDPDPAATAPLPVLDDDRMSRILEDVQAVIEEGDEAQDAELLTSRMSGPALQMREAEYRISEASDGEQAPTPLTTDSQVEVVTATDEWPRSVFVVSHIPEEANLPLLLVLTQEDARSQYKLWFWTSLLPGAQTPTTARPDVGSPPLTADAEGLLAIPAEAVAGYAELLADPESTDSYAPDPFRQSHRETIDALSGTVEVAGEVSESYDVQDGSVAAVGTDDGGALVVGVVRSRLTIAKTVEGATLDAGGEIALLMGEDSRIEGSATAEYLVPVALAVPPAGSDEQIQVLGAENVIADVTLEEPEDDEAEDDG